MSSDAKRRGLLIILSSPSGAGKSTLSRRLLEWDKTISFSVSATTRSPREGEVDGKDYHFMTSEEFEQDVNSGEMLEHATVFGNSYGSPKAPVRAAIEAGHDVLFDVDWQGAQQINGSDLSDHILSIFILPPSIAELRKRLEGRGQDDVSVIDKRMQKSLVEISHWKEYDYVLINDDLETADGQLKTIVTAARQRRLQQPQLDAHVAQLEAEFEAMT
ncbi:MAG: guanylate kinase [Pseudomonadota bacterium]